MHGFPVRVPVPSVVLSVPRYHSQIIPSQQVYINLPIPIRREQFQNGFYTLLNSLTRNRGIIYLHYENTPIQNFTTRKNEKFQIKSSNIFHISAQNMDCQYYYVFEQKEEKVGFKGIKII